MARSGRFDGDQGPAAAAALPTNSASFSQLLFGNDDDDDRDVLTLDLGNTTFNYHNDNSNCKLPKMLCFGGDQTDSDDLLFGNAGMASTPPQRSVVTCSDSCSSVSSVNNNNGALPKSNNKKRSGNLEVETIGNVKAPTAAAGRQGGGKKSKPEKAAAKGPVKVRKERLGERIAALQQLVSPFGKTDTASVLHEARGYIRFLQEQVQVLCSPYLQPLPAATDGGENGGEEEARRDLKSRGLCLVPSACTVHVESTNGADFWSPAMANNATN